MNVCEWVNEACFIKCSNGEYKNQLRCYIYSKITVIINTRVSRLCYVKMASKKHLKGQGGDISVCFFFAWWILNICE